MALTGINAYARAVIASILPQQAGLHCLLVSYRPLARYCAGLVKLSVCRGDEVTAREQLLEESFVATLDRCNAPSLRRVLPCEG